MNHDFIDALIDLYNNEPKDSPELVVMRMAVLVERCIRLMEMDGKSVTRDSMLEEIKRVLEQQGNAA